MSGFGTHIPYKSRTSRQMEKDASGKKHVLCKLQDITCMKQYQDKCREELRYEDYCLGRGITLPSKSTPIKSSPAQTKLTSTSPSTFSLANVAFQLFGKASEERIVSGFQSQTVVNNTNSYVIPPPTPSYVFGRNVLPHPATLVPAHCVFKSNSFKRKFKVEENNNRQIEAQFKSGVICSRSGYYISPSVPFLDMITKVQKGRCLIKGFEVGRRHFGKITFLKPVDVVGLNLDEIVQFNNDSLVMYPDDAKKPSPGSGLNVPAEIHMEMVFPVDENKIIIRCPEMIRTLQFEEKLKKDCEVVGVEFISYDETEGTWKFKVEHF